MIYDAYTEHNTLYNDIKNNASVASTQILNNILPFIQWFTKVTDLTTLKEIGNIKFIADCLSAVLEYNLNNTGSNTDDILKLLLNLSQDREKSDELSAFKTTLFHRTHESLYYEEQLNTFISYAIAYGILSTNKDATTLTPEHIHTALMEDAADFYQYILLSSNQKRDLTLFHKEHSVGIMKQKLKIAEYLQKEEKEDLTLELVAHSEEALKHEASIFYLIEHYNL